MTNEQKIIVVLSGCLVSGIGVAGYGLLQEHDARIKADAAVQVKESAIAQREQQIASSNAAIAERDKQDAQNRQLIQQQAAAIKTATDAARSIAAQVKTEPAPVVIKREDMSETEREKLPDAPSYMVQTESAAVETAKELKLGEADKKSLEVCKQDLADKDGQLQQQKEIAQDWQGIAKVREKQAKGGSKWSKALNVIKVAVPVAVVSYEAGKRGK